MQKVYKVETTLSHDLAELYSILEDEFASNSSIPLSDLNRTLLQTGMVHHLVMMGGLGILKDRESGLTRYAALGRLADGAFTLARLRCRWAGWSHRFEGLS
jgi:hypothetical protein